MVLCPLGVNVFEVCLQVNTGITGRKVKNRLYMTNDVKWLQRMHYILILYQCKKLTRVTKNITQVIKYIMADIATRATVMMSLVFRSAKHDQTFIKAFCKRLQLSTNTFSYLCHLNPFHPLLRYTIRKMRNIDIIVIFYILWYSFYDKDCNDMKIDFIYTSTG